MVTNELRQTECESWEDGEIGGGGGGKGASYACVECCKMECTAFHPFEPRSRASTSQKEEKKKNRRKTSSCLAQIAIALCGTEFSQTESLDLCIHIISPALNGLENVQIWGWENSVPKHSSSRSHLSSAWRMRLAPSCACLFIHLLRRWAHKIAGKVLI